jgi:hypothetical protein
MKKTIIVLLLLLCMCVSITFQSEKILGGKRLHVETFEYTEPKQLYQKPLNAQVINVATTTTRKKFTQHKQQLKQQLQHSTRNLEDFTVANVQSSHVALNRLVDRLIQRIPKQLKKQKIERPIPEDPNTLGVQFNQQQQQQQQTETNVLSEFIPQGAGETVLSNKRRNTMNKLVQQYFHHDVEQDSGDHIDELEDY